MKGWKPKFPRIRLPSIPLPLLGDVALLIGGFVMVARGLWQVYEPAMWIICGAILLWAGYPRGKGVPK